MKIKQYVLTTHLHDQKNNKRQYHLTVSIVDLLLHSEISSKSAWSFSSFLLTLWHLSMSHVSSFQIKIITCQKYKWGQCIMINVCSYSSVLILSWRLFFPSMFQDPRKYLRGYAFQWFQRFYVFYGKTWKCAFEMTSKATNPRYKTRLERWRMPGIETRQQWCWGFCWGTNEIFELLNDCTHYLLNATSLSWQTVPLYH